MKNAKLDDARIRGQQMDEEEYQASKIRNSPTSKEKRKSEVLIAAQSLDNELQNVKNLKRLSIGSMDLLMDPEMEFRINSSLSSSPTKSLSSEEEENDKEGYAEEYDDDYSYSEDSMDITKTEYLHDNSNDDYGEYNRGNRTGSVGVSEDAWKTTLEIADGTSPRRALSGTGSVRRGGVLSNRSRLSGGKLNDPNDEEALTQNLLWVPANQHPSVKPENYLELVQDTLQNLQLENGVRDESNKENTVKLIHGLNSNVSQLPIQQGKNSLVRRPSRLRKSYTEFEDTEEYNLPISGNSSSLPSSVPTPRSVSLREITDELTKVSNNAGLTDSDAITLARTLSMASTFYEGSNSEKENQSNTEKAEEDEFASNMLNQNSLAIPARSSLRRSKFNTYRIRTPSGSSTNEFAQSNLKVSSTEENPQPEIEVAVEETLPRVLEEHILNSPSTINDMQDIYDHYDTSSVEESLPPQNSNYSSAQQDGDNLQDSPDSSDFSTDSSTANAILKSKQSIVQTKSDSIQKEFLSPVTESTTADVKRQKKKGGWSWFNKKSKKEPEEDNLKQSEQHTHRDSSDFFNVLSPSNGTSKHNLPSNRINHSRNRHHSVVPASNDGSTSTATPTDMEMEKLPQKKQKLEKKFIKLFKKKHVSPDRKEKDNEISVRPETHSSKPVKELKNKASISSLSKICIGSNKVDENVDLTAKDRLKPRVSPGTKDVTNFQNESFESDGLEELPTLQPAVSVTSTKQSDGAIPGVLENKTVSKEYEQNQYNHVQQTLDQQQQQQQKQQKQQQQQQQQQSLKPPASPTNDPHRLPPRKLVFEDVKRPEYPNAPMKFTDSAFGFPLPPLTVSTVIMFDHRLPINVERAIYRLSHLKLSDPKRELRQQVLLSNFMYAYLNLVNHSLYLQQVEEENSMIVGDDSMNEYSVGTPATDPIQNDNNGIINIPEI